MHFCMDELLMIATGIPFIGFAILRVRTWFGKKTPVECCDHPHTHEEKEADVVRDV